MTQTPTEMQGQRQFPGNFFFASGKASFLQCWKRWLLCLGIYSGVVVKNLPLNFITLPAHHTISYKGLVAGGSCNTGLNPGGNWFIFFARQRYLRPSEDHSPDRIFQPARVFSLAENFTKPKTEVTEKMRSYFFFCFCREFDRFERQMSTCALTQ